MTRGAHPLDDQVLAVLRDTGGVPLSTLDICAGVGAAHRYSHLGMAVYRRLDALAHTGQVERWPVPNYRAVYWRRAD